MISYAAAGNPLTCRIHYDLEPGSSPAVGDYLVSQGKRGLGSAYLIIKVRQVRRRKPSPLNRWILTCSRVEVTSLICQMPSEGAVWQLYWYPRDRKQQPKTLGKSS